MKNTTLQKKSLIFSTKICYLFAYKKSHLCCKNLILVPDMRKSVRIKKK